MTLLLYYHSLLLTKAKINITIKLNNYIWGILQMKKHDKALNTYHRKLYVMMALVLCLFFMSFMLFFVNQNLAVDSEILTEASKTMIYKNANPLDLYKIIEENVVDNVKEEMVVEEIDLEYTTRYKNNAELASGVVQVLQEGRAGKKNAVVIKKYQDDELIAEQQVAENIIKAPVERIVEIGTGSQYNHYVAKEGDTVYVVATSVAVRLEPNENAEKICTLHQNDIAKVLKLEGDWYFISTVEIKGYVPSNCVTTKNPNQQENSQGQYTKQQLLANLSFDMDLRKPSGLTLEQFKKVLAGDGNDKKNVFAENAEYFYYVEKQYGINGIFVAAVGIHESGWGTSTIAGQKKNLFGYGAVDSNPYGGAYAFNTYAEGIDLVARVFVKYYLNSSGMAIYDGSMASGKFYSGSNLSAVNARYASDKNWANGVYKWMQYLYNKI